MNTLYNILCSILYLLLYVWTLVVILLKIRRKEKVHWLCYLTIVLLTLLPAVLMTFVSNGPISSTI